MPGGLLACSRALIANADPGKATFAAALPRPPRNPPEFSPSSPFCNGGRANPVKAEILPS